MTGPIALGPAQILAAAVLVLAAIGLLWLRRIDLRRDFAWGAVRTVAQLLLVGYVLRWIFAADAWLWVMAAFAVMLTAASWTATKRPKRRIPGMLARASLALTIGAGSTTLAVTALVVRASPWWDPRYFLPLAGMIIGNAMNAAALVAERLQAEISNRGPEIEELLALGLSPRQAADSSVRASIRASLLPTVNAMLTVGLVSLPGMMTGQMIAGADPTTAAHYQILVMFMLSAATTLSAVLLGALLFGRFFTPAWQLRTSALIED